jgi:hypothetical protein
MAGAGAGADDAAEAMVGAGSGVGTGGGATLLFEGESYPAAILEGRGTIGGFPVRCLTPEAQLIYHQGYQHDDNDVRDVMLLCETFALPVPNEYSNG